MKTNIIKSPSALLALFLTLLFCASTARAYEPIYTDKKKWVETISDRQIHEDNIYQQYSEVIGDTVIGGQSAKIIDCWRVPHAGAVWALYHWTGFGLIYPSHFHYYRLEEGGKVYDIKADGTKRLLMDFESPVGTSWSYQIKDYVENDIKRIFTIINCDTLTQNNKEFRRLTVQVKTEPYTAPASYSEDGYVVDNYVWIEGVGAVYNSALLGSTELVADWKSTLNFCLYPYGRYYFDTKDVKPVIPTAIESIAADEETADGKIYDLSGREVTHPQKGNVYIQGRRKIVWGD